MGVQHRAIAQTFARRVENYLRELPRVAQTDVEPLPGNGMQRLRRVAESDTARADRPSSIFQCERKCAPLIHLQESARPVPEMARELGQKGRFAEPEQL